jgi:hypothetical protein
MYPHRIRLRGPWTCQQLYRIVVGPAGGISRSSELLPPAFRVTMPSSWIDAGLGDFRGGLRLVRPFGYPGRIDDFERVWLTFAGLGGIATVTLNDTILGNIDGRGSPADFEITALLKPRNLLVVEIESQAALGGLWGEVALEVRATAFLRDVRFEIRAEQLVAHGIVIGDASRPLDLYLFAGGKFLTHDLVQPTVKGQPFTLMGGISGHQWPSPLPARVELVDVSAIWHVVEGAVDLPSGE